jgi:hypothetical protein
VATLSVQTVIRTGTGLEPTYASCASGGDEFVNTGNDFIHIKNGAGGAQTVTIATPVVTDGLAVAENAIAIPAGEERMIGILPKTTYNDGDAKVQLTYSAVTSLTIGIFKAVA